MRKYFCDRCGVEITENNNNVLTNDSERDNLFFDTSIKKFVGEGKDLCNYCYQKRLEAHLRLDQEFFKGTKRMSFSPTSYQDLD